MNAQNVTVTADVTARRRAGVTGALVVLVVLLALVSLGIGPVRLSPLTVIGKVEAAGGAEIRAEVRLRGGGAVPSRGYDQLPRRRPR